MESKARGRSKKEPPGAAPGVFRPAVPGDASEVMHLFAVAARAVCASPQNLEEVSKSLEQVAVRLVPPEAAAAQECLRLWQLFARVARAPKASLRLEAGRAYCRDLDALGQRLDLPPMAEWDELPDGLAAAGAPVAAGTAHRSLATAREILAALFTAGKKGHEPALETARCVAGLGNDERRQLFESVLGRGVLGRSDVNLLIRFLVKGDAVGPADTVLIEVLERLGRFVAS